MFNLKIIKNINLSELTLANLAIWPLPVKWLIIMSCFLLVLGLGYGFEVKLQWQALQASIIHERELYTQLKAKQKDLIQIKSDKKYIEQLQQNFASQLQQFPERAAIPQLLERISKAALMNGLQINYFTPQPEQSQGFFMQLPMKISVIGSFQQLCKFVIAISQLNHLVILQNFSLQPVDKNADKLAMQIQLATFCYVGTIKLPPVIKIKTGMLNSVTTLSDTMAVSRNPFQPYLNASGARKKQPLEFFSLPALKMVGALWRDNKWWGLVLAPNEEVYKVVVGSFLGHNNGRVIEINQNKIKVLEILAEGNVPMELTLQK